MCMEHVMRRVEHQGQHRATVGKHSHTLTKHAVSVEQHQLFVQSEISLSLSASYGTITHGSLTIRIQFNCGVVYGKKDDISSVILLLSLHKRLDKSPNILAQ